MQLTGQTGIRIRKGIHKLIYAVSAFLLSAVIASGTAAAQTKGNGQDAAGEGLAASGWEQEGLPAGKAAADPGADGQIQADLDTDGQIQAESGTAGQAAAEAVAGQEDMPEIYGRGSYVIGRDMPPGEYAVFTEDTSGNRAFSSSTLTLYKNDSDEKKIGTFRFQHHGLITLYNGQHLILSKGYAVLADQAGITPGPTGMYKAGRDMEPGTYRLTPLTSDGAHYALYNDVRYYYDYMDDYQTFFQPVEVTVAEGQYIELMDVSAIEKVI